MMDIAEVARRSGLKPSTLRYYEKIGLIHSPSRKGLRRQYFPSVLNKLNIISLGRMAGLSLIEISMMFDANDELSIDRTLLIQKTTEIDAQIKQLQAIRNSLFHVATCPQTSHLECPSFQKMMSAVKRDLS
ncbi:helix-turn-helix domain-containing protein [Agarivorans sp. Z349TD_8]|uniref:helix-turn-helix domain-containing protein n=1 Tax=Agarivorans sp. Z349TD_8 TaxID=3421434 RepID=UPI003D7C85E6